MSNATSPIRFRARLLRPAATGKRDAWSFLILPGNASAQLPRRGMTTVDGTINGQPFRATLEPDGQRSHWLKVNRKLRDGAAAEPGDTVAMEIMPVQCEPDPKVPADLKKALAGAPKAIELWRSITPLARLDWIHWIQSAKQKETRAKRIANACDMLACGKKRVCCFDPSGVYDKGMSAPQAAE